MRLVALLFCGLFLLPQNLSAEDTTPATQTNVKKLFSYIAGTGILAFEFVGFPLFDVYASNHKFPELKNPFNYVKENEPYMEDELWHLVGASVVTEFNSFILENLFSMDDPYILSGLLSLFLWTSMECMDALIGSGFSLRDEAGDFVGSSLGIIRLYYPNFPIRVRIGVKNWKSFKTAANNVVKQSIHHQLGKQYDYMKVDFIYMMKSSIYYGFSVSRKPNRDNQYGLTLGFDAIDWLNNLKKGWWNRPVNLFNNSFSMGIGFTWWMN